MASTTTIARSSRSVSTTRSGVDGKWVDILHDGSATDEPWMAAGRVMCAYIRAGRSYADFEADSIGRTLYRDAFIDREDTGTRTMRAAAVKARRAWDRAAAHVRNNPPITGALDAHDRLIEIRDAIRAYDWAGRTGIRDRIVLAALLDVAEMIGTIQPIIPVRDLCEDTPYASHQAVSRALKALAVRGWLDIDRKGRVKEQPSRYVLRIPTERAQRTKTLTSPPGGTPGALRPSAVQPSDGVQARKLAMALTPCGQAVYAALTNIPQTRAQVAAAAGVSPRTAGRWLNDLAVIYGLAHKSGPKGDLGWVASERDPDIVVFQNDVSGKEITRRDRHERERDEWAKVSTYIRERKAGASVEDAGAAAERAPDARRRKPTSRVAAMRHERDVASLQGLAERPPKPRPRWREDAAEHDARVWEEFDRQREIEEANLWTDAACATTRRAVRRPAV